MSAPAFTHFAFWGKSIATANADMSIPLDSYFVAEIASHHPATLNRLVAQANAAPELYEALRNIEITLCESTARADLTVRDDALAIARAALAKVDAA